MLNKSKYTSLIEENLFYSITTPGLLQIFKTTKEVFYNFVFNNTDYTIFIRQTQSYLRTDTDTHNSAEANPAAFTKFKSSPDVKESFSRRRIAGSGPKSAYDDEMLLQQTEC